ncbi:hypothetical protein [Antribacter gilvus]|uniref:hypothetical protein n=1 Tax=Antribacter gilvus TaxID=2304675 RepID=UPI000F77F4E7|nr:hypothetical protein [Antribacter gilvus]
MPAHLSHRTERWAVTWSVLAGVLFALTQTFAVAPFASADESAHVDYAYQVWHGGLPVFEEGLVLDPPLGFVPPVQWTAQHPPLYYLLLAPAVGPLVDAGRHDLAAYAGRACSVLLLMAFVVAAWWAARQVTRPDSPLPAAVALVVACSAWAVRLGGSAYNDLLAALLVTVLIGLTARALRDGLHGRLVAALTLVAAATSLTRAAALVLAVVCIGVTVLASLFSRQSPTRHTIALAVSAPAAVLLASGWFYLRNHRLTGSLTGGHPDWAAEHLGRTTRTFWEAVTDYGTWLHLLDVYLWGGFLPLNTGAVLLLLVPAAFVAGATLVRRRYGTSRTVVADARAAALALVPVTAAALLLQVAYTTTSGASNPRYLLPVLVPLSLVVAAFMALRPWLTVSLWVVVVLVDFGAWLAGRMALPPGAGYPAMTDVALVTGWSAAAAALVAATLVVLTIRRAPVQH